MAQIAVSLAIILGYCKYWLIQSKKNQGRRAKRKTEKGKEGKISVIDDLEHTVSGGYYGVSEKITGNRLMFSEFLFFNVFHVLCSVFVVDADEIGFVIGIIVFGWKSNVFNIYVCVKARSKAMSCYHYVYVCGLMIAYFIKHQLKLPDEGFYIVIIAIVWISDDSSGDTSDDSSNDKPINSTQLQLIILFGIICFVHSVLSVVAHLSLQNKLYLLNLLYIQTFGLIAIDISYVGYIMLHLVTWIIFTCVYRHQFQKRNKGDVISESIIKYQIIFVFMVFYVYSIVSDVTNDFGNMIDEALFPTHHI